MTIQRLERGHASKNLVRGIIPIFGPWKITGPPAGPLMNETTQILLHTMVNYLCLSVSLWMVRRTKLQFGARKLEEFLPKFTNKNGIAVTNNRNGHAVKLDNSFYKLVSHSFSSKGMS
jgi:hypothetical protein